MKVGATSESWYSMSVSPRSKASQRLCVSSITLISTVPMSGSFLPFMRATISLSRGSAPGWKSQVTLRKPGLASSTIFEERT